MRILGCLIDVGLTKPDSVDPSTLTPRELEILVLIAEDNGISEIGAKLGIDHKTVDYHKQAMYRKIGVRSMVGACRYAIAHGLIVVEVLCRT